MRLINEKDFMTEVQMYCRVGSVSDNAWLSKIKRLLEKYTEDVPDTNVGKWRLPQEAPEIKYGSSSDYILLSFSKFPVPAIGRYEEDENGGAYFIGDNDDPAIKNNLFVNAWMPLPEPYKEREK